MNAERIPVLCYHSVSPACDPRFSEWTVTPEQFASQMAHLVENGHRPLAVRELVQLAFENRGRLDPGAVAITFDDGFADFYTHAWPELRRHSFPATLFVATGYVDGTSTWLASEGEGERPMLSWSQIEEISRAGIECGAHGHDHVQLDTVSAARAEAEITRSRDALREVVGEVRSFAYPHGYFTSRLQRQVARAGFTSACAVKDALTSAEDDRFAISRAVVRGGAGIDAFAAILRGDGMPVAPRDGRLRRGAWRTVRRAGAEPVVRRLGLRHASTGAGFR